MAALAKQSRTHRNSASSLPRGYAVVHSRAERCARKPWESHSVSFFAAPAVVAPCFSFAGLATGDTPTAVIDAGARCGGFSGGRPTGGMSRIPKSGKITATGNGSGASATVAVTA